MNKFVRIALGCLTFVAVFEGVWFFGTRSYLNSEAFFKRINTAELQFDARDGYSPWPGFFQFKKFVFTGFADDATYQVKAEVVSFHFNILQLLRNRVAINGLKASDVTIEVEEGAHSLEGTGKVRGGGEFSEADRSDPKGKPSEAGEGSAEAKGKDDKLWTTVFSGVRFSNLHQVKVASWLWTGHADLKASFQTDSKGFFVLEESEADARDLAVVHGAEKFATIDLANIKSSTQPFSLNEKEWQGLLTKISTRWQLKGKLDSLESLDPFIKNLDWFELAGSALTVDGDVGMEKGSWREGSELIFAAETVNVNLMRQNIYGPASFQWHVGKSNHLELKFGEFFLNKGRDGSGKGFLLTLDTADKGVIPQWQEWSAHALLPSTQINRVQFLQQYIPQSLPLTLEKGQGFLSGEFHASSNVKQSQGQFLLKIKDLQALYKKSLRFVGSADSKIKINRMNLKKGEIGIEDAGVEVKDLTFLDRKDWNGSLHFTEASVNYEKPVALSSRVELSGDNLQPVLAFLVNDRSFPEWIQKAFDLKQPKVDFHIEATEKAFSLRDFKAQAGDLAIMGWMDQSNGSQSTRARFLLDYAGLTGAYGLDGEHSQWKLSNARAWYDEQRRSKL